MKANTTAIALPDEDDPWLSVANEGGGQFGKMIKFAKGEWLHGDDDIPPGTEFVVLIRDAMRGWVRFADKKPVEYRLGYVRDNNAFANRDELGFTDRSIWEKNDRGEPNDPWAQQHYLPLQHCENGELYCWVFGSHGAKQAFRDLARAYSPYRKTAMLPIVSLQTDSYRHDTYGKIHVPVLKVERWHDWGTAPVVEVVAPTKSDMNDDIPF
jgi:hypothetical protein